MRCLLLVIGFWCLSGALSRAQAQGDVGGLEAAAEGEDLPGQGRSAAVNDTGWRGALRGFYVHAGALYIAPLGRSEEVELEDVDGAARLSIQNGPVAGSFVELGGKLMPAMIVGYRLPVLSRQLSVETILGLPFALQLKAGGTLADRSLAPTALGNVPTGIPALGAELGEVTVLPPVLTVVYRLLPSAVVRPYVGAGLAAMIPLSAEITNPVLTAVTQPTVEVDPRIGWVLQAGVDINVVDTWFVRADVKYLGGLNLEARVENIWVRTPELPLYESVRVGSNVVRLRADPLVLMLSMGLEL